MSLAFFKKSVFTFSSKVRFTLHFTNKNIKTEIETNSGKSLLDVFLENKLPGVGVCGGKLLCGSCHCILPKDIYDETSEKGYEEDDILSIALGSEETSRCGCQVIVTEKFNEQTIRMPPLSTSEIEESKI